MRILALGGTGFIGSRVCKKLAATNETAIELMIISKNASGSPLAKAVSHLPNITFMDFDMRSPEVLKIVSAFKPTVIINMYGQVHPRNSSGKEVSEIETGILGFFRILEESTRFDLDKVIFASSAGALYSARSGYEKNRPDSTYFALKKSTELLLECFCVARDISGLSLRVSNPVGQNEKKDFGVVNAISRALKSGERPKLFGDYSTAKDYVDLDDVAEAFVKTALEAESFPQQDFHICDIGSGVALSALDILEILDSEHNKRVANLHTMRKKSGLDLEHTRRTINWAPKRDVLKTITNVYMNT